MSGNPAPPIHPMAKSFVLAHWLGIFLAGYPVRGRGAIQKVIRRFLVPEPQGPTQIRTRFGIDLVVDPTIDHGLEHAIYYDGVYEAGTLAVMRQTLRRGDIVLDVGANIGLMSLVAARCVGAEGRVYAVEPEPETFNLLEGNILLNGAERVIPINLAAGSASGSAVIHSRLHVSRGSATLVLQEGEEDKCSPVEVETIDNLCTSHTIGTVRLLKIDVEGWELEVLRGARGLLSRFDAPIVIIECSPLHAVQGGQASDIYSLLGSMNDYRIYRLTKGKSSPSPLAPVGSARDIPHHDNLFCFLSVHLESLPPGLFVQV